MKILFLIRALTPGGAERQVALLARGLREAGHAVGVAVFYGGGELEADLANAAVPLIDLGKRGRWDNAAFLRRLVRTLRREQPDVVYSFLTVANLLTGLLAPAMPGVKRVWGLRASNMDLSRYDWLSRITDRLEARLARSADLIIVNSQAGLDAAVARGFPPGRLSLVRNGIDTRRFFPDRALGAPLRRGWGVGPEDVLIGLVGRLDPMKGHPEFLRAAALLRAAKPGARFVCVGEGPAGYRRTLTGLATDLGLDAVLTWAGNRQDMPAVYNALDIAVSASLYGEGVSNTLGEAMASGVPCVTTAVGDSAWIVGETGRVVAPGAPEALARAMAALYEHLERAGGAPQAAARQRIVENLSVQALIDRTAAALGRLP